MAREQLIDFHVNGRMYKLYRMPPVEACTFGMELAGALLPSVSAVISNGNASVASIIESLGKSGLDIATLNKAIVKARPFLTFEDGSRGDNAAMFNKWFTEHPEDLYSVSLLSVWHSVADFMPPLLRTVVESYRSSVAKASQSTSQTGSV